MSSMFQKLKGKIKNTLSSKEDGNGISEIIKNISSKEKIENIIKNKKNRLENLFYKNSDVSEKLIIKLKKKDKNCLKKHVDNLETNSDFYHNLFFEIENLNNLEINDYKTNYEKNKKNLEEEKIVFDEKKKNYDGLLFDLENKKIEINKKLEFLENKEKYFKKS